VNRIAAAVVRIAWVCGTVAAVGFPCGAQEPAYVKRLNLPTTADSIAYPRAITADQETGEIFVCDTRRNRIVVFDEDGHFRFEISGGREFSAPTDLAVDRDGFLFVLANHDRHRALIRLDFDGMFLEEIPVVVPPATEFPAGLNSVAISPLGDRLYVVDEANLMLWVLDRAGEVQAGVDLAEGLEQAQRQDFIVGKVDVYGESVLLTMPTTGEVRIYDLNGTLQERVGRKGTASCRLGFPTAAALDADGGVLVLDQQRMFVLRWTVADNRCVAEWFGLGGGPGFLYFPIDIALDRRGGMYVTQGFEGRVQAFDGMIPATPMPPRPDEVPDEAPSETVRAVVEGWSRAWSERRIDDYLAFYADDFSPWGVPDRRSWERWRRAQMGRDGEFEVQIGEIEIEFPETETARAVFVEDVRSSRYETHTRKTVLLVREVGGVWKIIEERGESAP